MALAVARLAAGDLSGWDGDVPFTNGRDRGIGGCSRDSASSPCAIDPLSCVRAPVPLRRCCSF